MKIEIDDKVLLRVCDAALRQNGINSISDVIMITNAVQKAAANSEPEFDKKPKENANVPKANNADMAK